MLLDGELLWAAPPRPGATVDITAAREAKKELTTARRAANRLQAGLRCAGEPATPA